MKTTLRLISSELIQIAKGESFNIEDAVQLPLPDPTGPFVRSPMKEVSQEEYEAMIAEDNVSAIIDEETPNAKAMPFAAGETGKSPNRKGKVFDLVDEEIEKRCQKCLGIYPMKLISDPNDESPKRMRRHCVLCGRKCNTFCSGCKKVLCLLNPPQDRKVKEMVKIEQSQIKTVWKKVPSSFFVDVPHLDKDGNVKIDSNGPVYTRLYGEATCYHIAHQKRWQEYLLEQQAELVTQVDEATKKAEKKARKRTKKKKSKKAKKG